jgi:hypothetical protein
MKENENEKLITKWRQLMMIINEPTNGEMKSNVNDINEKW